MISDNPFTIVIWNKYASQVTHFPNTYKSLDPIFLILNVYTDFVNMNAFFGRNYSTLYI